MLEVSCRHCKNEFVIEVDDLAFYKKMQVPSPTFCPECRFQRRCSYINVRNLYARDVPGVGPNTISMYSPEKKLNIVEDRAWWGDKYDVLAFGRDYDFSKPFFTQFSELWSKVPLPHLQREFSTFQNSDYCNAAAGLKNCYLIINADYDEECMYGFCVEKSKYCVDITFTFESELCYQGMHLKNCYDCRYCEECESSNGLRFCRDCIGCTDSIGCIGLRHKKYHIFNKEFSPEEYKKEAAKLNLTSWSAVQELLTQADRFFLTKPRKFMQGRNNQNVSGDCINESKNVQESYVIERAEECKFCHLLRYFNGGTNYAYDYTMFGVGAELMYEAAWCGLHCHNVKFSLWNYGTSDAEYCIGCHASKNMFGCIGVRHGKFCIFNKQYTEDEFNALVPKIKKQMMEVPYVDKNGNEYHYGEFFPTELSPFCYNQTVAQEFCPITQEECSAKGFGWYKGDRKKLSDFIHWKDLPDDIKDVSDDILSKPILCKANDEDAEKAHDHNCTRVFKIIPQELELYRRLGIPLPRTCHNTRHRARLSKLNPFRTWTRQCMKCSGKMETSFGPERPEIVLCEKCYLKEVY